MRLKKICKNKLAFTLVELIVVIAILGILAAVASVATIAILNNTRKNAVSTDAGVVKTALQNNAISITKNTDVDTINSILAANVEGLEVLEPADGTAPDKPSGKSVQINASSGDAKPLAGTDGLQIFVMSEYYWVMLTVKFDDNDNLQFDISDPSNDWA